MSSPQPKKRLPLVVVLLPLVAVLGIAGVVGWNLYREYQRTEAEEADTGQQAAIGRDEKIRGSKPPKEVVKPETPPSEEDELGNLPGQQKKKTVKPTNQTPAQKAYFGFKSAYEKLENVNENAARKFRVRKLQLDDQYSGGKPSNESKFVADCDATRAQILEALRNPENQ